MKLFPWRRTADRPPSSESLVAAALGELNKYEHSLLAQDIDCGALEIVFLHPLSVAMEKLPSGCLMSVAADWYQMRQRSLHLADGQTARERDDARLALIQNTSKVFDTISTWRLIRFM